MEITKVWALYYSATGTTDKAVNTIAEELDAQLTLPIERLSFTRPAERTGTHLFTAEDLVVVGSPTYAGRLPNKIAPDFRSGLRGEGTPAVPVVLFGNRSYDNALAELWSVLMNNAAQIAGKLRSGRGGTVAVPGVPDAPYYIPKGVDGEPVKFLQAKPRTDPGKCTNCGACARLCPMGAIDPRDVFRVPGTCIKCQCCVRKCTRHAKYFDDPAFLSHVAMLEQNFAEPKENEVFL